MDGIPARLISALGRTRHLVVLTGAGVSAESGVPTFRDAQSGLWSRYQPEDLATAAAFERDPALVWQWYQWRRGIIAAARPNAGHLALAALERLVAHLTLVTQNVDGLHQSAGSRNVIEFHGNIMRNRCSVEHTVVMVDVAGSTKPPRCPSCGSRLRPDVIWLGEAVSAGALTTATVAASDCDIFIAAGTSGVLQPAASLAGLAKSNGALIVEINPQQTPISEIADFRLRQSAAFVLPALAAAVS